MSLTVDEVIEFDCASELLRRAKRGEVYIVSKQGDEIEAAYDEGCRDQGSANREQIVSDVVDLLFGEVWAEGMTDDQRQFLIEDLNLYVVGDADD